MTISTTTSRVDYTGDGSSTAFSVPFPFFDQTELRVLERVIATGAETTLALSTNYTVSGGAGAVGTVTAVVAPAATKKWTILRNTRRTQEVDYLPNDPFPAETHERALDRLTAEIQENERDAARSLRIAETDPSSSLTLPSSVDRASKVLGFNAAGEPVAVVPEAGSLVVTAYAQSLLDDPDAATARATLGAADRLGADLWGGTAGGTANALTLSFTPTLGTFPAGVTVRFIAAAANTGNMTVNGTPLRRSDASEVPTGLVQAGDMIEAVSDGTQLRCLPRADDNVISAGTITALTAVDFTFQSKFRAYRFTAWDIQTSAAAAININALVAGVPDTGASDYTFNYKTVNGATVTGGQSTTSAITVSPVSQSGAQVGRLAALIIPGSASGGFFSVASRFDGVDSTPALANSDFEGRRVASGAKSGFRILPGSGNFSFRYTLEGIR